MKEARKKEKTATYKSNLESSSDDYEIYPPASKVSVVTTTNSPFFESKRTKQKVAPEGTKSKASVNGSQIVRPFCEELSLKENVNEMKQKIDRIISMIESTKNDSERMEMNIKKCLIEILTEVRCLKSKPLDIKNVDKQTYERFPLKSVIELKKFEKELRNNDFFIEMVEQIKTNAHSQNEIVFYKFTSSSTLSMVDSKFCEMIIG